MSAEVVVECPKSGATSFRDQLRKKENDVKSKKIRIGHVPCVWINWLESTPAASVDGEALALARVHVE